MIKKRIWALYQARLSNGALQEFTEIHNNRLGTRRHAECLTHMYEESGCTSEIICLAVFGFDCFSAETNEEQTILSNGNYELLQFDYAPTQELRRNWYVPLNERAISYKNTETISSHINTSILNEMSAEDCCYYISDGISCGVILSRNCEKLSADIKHHIDRSVSDLKSMLKESCIWNDRCAESVLEECVDMLKKVQDNLEYIKEQYEDCSEGCHD